jgi:parvulin-like peptidyl-prolyl isomerase
MNAFDGRRMAVAVLLAAMLAAAGCVTKNLELTENQPDSDVNNYLDGPDAAVAAATSEESGVQGEVEYVVARPRVIDGVVVDSPAAAATDKTALPQAVDADLDADVASVFAADSVLAEVNGEAITLQTVLGPVQAEMRRWSKECTRGEFQDRCRGLVALRVREAVTERLLADEARAQLSADERQRLSEAAAPGTPAADAMLVQAFLREKIGPQVRVAQSEMLGLYRQIREQRYVVPTEVRLGLIMIRKSDSATPEWAESLAKAVRSRVAGGEDFATLAQRYGRDKSAPSGGDYGFIREGGFGVRAVEDALFALEAGQVAQLVETPEAYYVVKALDRHQGRTVPFDEVQAALEQELRSQKYNTRVANYSQELYERWRAQSKTAAASTTSPIATAGR